jgi:hypothetical protein
MVFFSPNVQIRDALIGDSCVNGGFCAYHNTGGTIDQPLIYGALMDEFTSACAKGCGGDSTALENQTDTDLAPGGHHRGGFLEYLQRNHGHGDLCPGY